MSTSAESIVLDGLVSVEEARAFLSISRSSLYELMDQGRLPFAKIGRSRRIPKRALVAFAARNLHGDLVSLLMKCLMLAA